MCDFVNSPQAKYTWHPDANIGSILSVYGEPKYDADKHTAEGAGKVDGICFLHFIFYAVMGSAAASKAMVLRNLFMAVFWICRILSRVKP